MRFRVKLKKVEFKIQKIEFVIAIACSRKLYCAARGRFGRETALGGKMKIATFILAASALVAGHLSAGEIAPKDVRYDDYGAVETPLTSKAGDSANGAIVMKSKSIGNCIACHALADLNDAPFHGEIGPALDGVGDRWNEAEIRGIVSNAKMTFEGSMMPAYYKVDGFIRPGRGFTGKAADGPLTPLLTAQQIEDVVAFLLTQRE